MMGAEMRGMTSLRRKLVGLNELEKRAVRPVVAATAEAIERAAAASAPESFDVTHEIRNEGLSAAVGTNDFRAHWREFGTSPHAIEPKNRKILAWVDENGPNLARRVEHPGEPAKPFLFPAFERERPGFRGEVARALNTAHRKAAKS